MENIQQQPTTEPAGLLLIDGGVHWVHSQRRHYLDPNAGRSPDPHGTPVLHQLRAQLHSSQMRPCAHP